jgi:phosphatidylinositol alpha-1,6-mannosyltransferase
VYYYKLLRELVEHTNNDVTLLTRKVPGWQEFDRVQSIARFSIIRSGRPLPSWKYQQLPKIAGPLLRAGWLLTSKRFDVVHVGDLYPQGVLGLWFKRIFGKPYVAYCHGEEVTQTDGRRFQPYVRNAIYREADVVVAANEFARQNLLRIGITEERIRKILPGVDCDRFRPAPPHEALIRKHGLEGKTVLLTVGRLVLRKGHATVIEAMRSLVGEFPELVFLIVGTGPEEKALRALTAQSGLTDHVRFAGFVEDDDLPLYYNLCDLFVLPNLADGGDVEGFGMVFLEANACGKAVVGARSGGAAEAVLDGKTGMLVEPKDPIGLACVLRSLLRDRERTMNIGLQGLKRAQTDFTWTSRGIQLQEINTSIVNKYR